MCLPVSLMSPIYFSPLIAIHLSAIVAGGVWLSASFQFICLLLQQFICLTVWLVVSGAPDVSDWFVSPYSNWFVSQSGLWCPALCMSPIHLFPLIAIHLSPRFAGSVRLSGWFNWAIHLSPSLAGGVRLSGCLQFIFYSNSFVSQSGWWSPAVRMSPTHLSFFEAVHLSPSVAGGVQLSICFPL